ncbi:MAG: TetR/AcrR family transcriptional regulator [Clostridia bacterium]|nr:TetR/AcrR family transcriptional regulator [Clostridia bacterium]
MIRKEGVIVAKQKRNTKGKIISAAWELFYEQGYDDTTVEEIIERSGTSKGSFYHYFDGKDALLSSLSFLFDEEYARLQQELDPDIDAWDKLLHLNRALFAMIDSRISMELLARLLSSQLITKGNKHLLDHDRLYFKYLRQIVREGQDRGQITDALTANEIVKLYALTERSLMYDWCLCGGEYSLTSYAEKMMPMFLGELRAKK